MMSESGNRFPQNILEAFGFFGDPDACIDFVASTRWPIGPKCPRGQCAEHSYLTTRRLWKCKACKRQFSVKVGTIFENSAVPLDKWLSSIWLVANIKDGVSSYELSWWIGVTQKSAWFVLHRIRLAAHVGEFDVFDPDVEVEETNCDDVMKHPMPMSEPEWAPRSCKSAEFGRFEKLTKKLLAVRKQELDEARAREQAGRSRQRSSGPQPDHDDGERGPRVDAGPRAG